MKVVRVYIKHFREEYIETTHNVPKRDGTFKEVPRASSWQRVLFHVCFLDVHLTIQHQKRSVSHDSKEEESLNTTIQMSSVSETEERDRY